MRLTRPTLTSPLIVTCENKDLPGHLLNTSLKNDITSIDNAESLGIGQFLLVPQSFGYEIFQNVLFILFFILSIHYVKINIFSELLFEIKFNNFGIMLIQKNKMTALSIVICLQNYISWRNILLLYLFA